MARKSTGHCFALFEVRRETNMSIQVQFVTTRKKRIQVKKVTPYWQEFIELQEDI